jgi:NSS family neurotransmitter:Na+ symporter
MPLAFAEIGKGGMFLSVVFFGLVVLAALTSAISLLEVVVSYFIDEWDWPRARAAWMLGGIIFAFSIPCAFAMDGRFVMTGWEPGYGMNFFDTMDYLASNWLLPLGGLFIALYAGWVMPRRYRDAEFEGTPPWLVRAWVVLIRFVAPLLVILVLLQKAGFLDADEILFSLLH